MEKSSPSEDALEVNRCRSLCKDFWRDAYALFDIDEGLGEHKLKTWANRHHRFKEQVKSLEVLEGYVHDGEEDYVYQPHSLIEPYLHNPVR